MDTDRTERGRVTVRRVDVRGAAEVLDISAEAVRKRIARGTIPHEKDEEGNVWVLLDGQEDGDRTASGHREDGSTMPLLSRMEDEIAYLRSELHQRAEEIGRRDAIIMQLSQANAEMARTVRELEAPPAQPMDERDRRPTISDDSGNGTAPGYSQEPVERRSSWWRRWFGFD